MTRPSGLNPKAKDSQDYQALTVHDNLAIKICNEILSCPCSPEVRVYTKALSSLELSSDLANKDLLVLLNEILEQVKDRTCLRALEKIKIQLEKGNKENGDQAVAAQDDGTVTTLFQSEEKNKEVYITPVKDVKVTRMKSTQKQTNRGRRTVTASARMSRRRQTEAETDSESDHEVPEPESEMKMRLPRRAKTAALEKSKLSLAQFLNE